jgi:hypothetical protein
LDGVPSWDESNSWTACGNVSPGAAIGFRAVAVDQSGRFAQRALTLISNKGTLHLDAGEALRKDR